MRRAAALAAAAVALALVRLPWRPHTVCLLRATTGIPCPLCGGTTAGVRVGQGRIVAALQANPVVVVGAVVLILAGSSPGQRAVRSWRSLPGRSRVLLGAAVLVFAECWQLARFGLF